MYGKIKDGKFVEGIVDITKTAEAQKFEMMMYGFLPVIEIDCPGLGYTLTYKRVGNKLQQIWTYSKEQHIEDLKHQLRDTDYAVIKIAEGVATKEEYADVIAQRAEWRAKINELQEQ